MTALTRSSVMAIVRETTEGTLVDPSAGGEFIPLREGFTFAGEVNTVETNTLRAGDVGQDKSFVTNETPTGTNDFYWKHSGVEAQEPELGLIFEAAMGAKSIAATEYDTVGGSTTTVLNVDTGEGATFQVGEGLLIKDSVNGYSVRTISSISSDALTLNYALDNAPASGVNLGRAVLYYPGTSHPTFSVHRYQATSSAEFKDASAGNRVTSLSLETTANDLASGSFEFAGISYYYNPIRITAGSNDALDFNIGGGELNATVAAGVYKSPIALAEAIELAMDAVSADDITVTFNKAAINGLFTIETAGATLSLLWNTGTNTATTIGSTIGFDTAADDTAATEYSSDNEQSYDPPVTPSYDDIDPVVIQGAELFIGDQDQNICLKATNVSATIATPKTDVASICAETGIDSSVILERTSELTAQIVLEKHKVDLFNKFINNISTQAQLAWGKKSSGNWQAGKTQMITFLNASITAHPVADNDGYQVIDVAISGFVGTNSSDVYLNFL